MKRYGKRMSKAREEQRKAMFEDTMKYFDIFDPVYIEVFGNEMQNDFWIELDSELNPLFFSEHQYIGGSVFVSRLALGAIKNNNGDFPVKDHIYPALQSRYCNYPCQIKFQDKRYFFPPKLISLHGLSKLVSYMEHWGFAEYPGGRHSYKITPLGGKFFRLTLSSLTSHLSQTRNAENGGNPPSLLDQNTPKETETGSGWIARLNPKNWS